MTSTPLALAFEEKKARGAFFTPPDLSNFITTWAIRSSQDRILEPSCGEAAFLLPAASRLRQLGAMRDLSEQLTGVDIHPETTEHARDLLVSHGSTPTIHACDFFSFRSDLDKYDAVIGNPPYVRYQSFAGEARVKALEAALRQGVRLTGLASSWAAFTIHAASFLKPNGRLGLVLPAELLSVNYAAAVRRFLLNRFSSVRLVLFESLIFPGVLEEVVLLLAEGTGGANRFEVFQARDLDDLSRISQRDWTGYTPHGGDKWTSALLPGDALETYHDITNGESFEILLDWGDTYLGAVTGNNEFFALPYSMARKLGIPSRELTRISPPGSKHLRGLTFSVAAWNRLLDADEPCLLFNPGNDLSAAAKRYIRRGEDCGVHKAYKCKVRAPWWRVPMVQRPDLIFTYMNHQRPRLTANNAAVHILNSLYGIKLKPSRTKLGRDLLPILSLNSITLLGAEVVGRSYGGGMLKHEPKEADVLPVPSVEVIKKCARELQLLRPQVAAALRRNDITPATDIVDKVLLSDALGVSAPKIQALRQARELLFQRRMSRSKGQRG